MMAAFDELDSKIKRNDGCPSIPNNNKNSTVSSFADMSISQQLTKNDCGKEPLLASPSASLTGLRREWDKPALQATVASTSQYDDEEFLEDNYFMAYQYGYTYDTQVDLQEIRLYSCL